MMLRGGDLLNACLLLLVNCICDTLSCSDTKNREEIRRIEFHKNKRLAGYSLVNITNTKETSSHCQINCIGHCGCVSVNMKKTKDGGEECELNYESIEKDQSILIAAEGLYYLEFERIPRRKCTDTKPCNNGCCKTDPCLNGGICTELCDHPKYRFNCTCLFGFGGRLCSAREGFVLQFQDGTIADYVMMSVNRQQVFTEFTLSLRIKTNDKTKQIHSFFSYATQEDSNAILLERAKESDGREYLLVTVAMVKTKVYVTLTDGVWHHIVVILGFSSQYSVYVDDTPMRTSSQVQGIISSEGKVVLGQDQDNLGGGFADNQAYIGDLSDVNFWDRVMPLDELQFPTSFCYNNIQGNVIAWNKGILDAMHGSVAKTRLFPC